MYLISFIFSFTFYNKLLKFVNFSLVKKLTTVCRKAKFLSKFLLEKFAFYGLHVDMELETEPEP